MIVLKTKRELEIMREAGRIAAKALQIGGEHCKTGVNTKEIDTAIRRYILSQSAVPSFYGYDEFPANACISINDEVIHGIPSKIRFLKNGDIVSIDVGAIFGGYHGDTARTFTVGEEVSQKAIKLLEITEKSLGFLYGLSSLFSFISFTKERDAHCRASLPMNNEKNERNELSANIPPPFFRQIRYFRFFR